jgi:hypothetical protein
VTPLIVPSDQFIETDAEHPGKEFETSHSPAIATWAKIRGDWFTPISAGVARIGSVIKRWWETLEVAVCRAVTRNYRKYTRRPVKCAKSHDLFFNPARLGCLG